MNSLRKLLHFFDRLSELIGKAFGFLVIALMVFVVYDVMARYIFNRPTLWGLELNGFLLLGITCLGGGYALLHDAHVRVNILHDRFSPRVQATVDLFTYVGLFMFCVVLLLHGGEVAFDSLRKGTVTPSMWAPVMWPSQMLVPIGAALILLQGLAKWIRNLYLAVTGKQLDEKPSVFAEN
jgi:TRAP-type mannitol/chloroaromatic compound transport system permease small subunit